MPKKTLLLIGIVLAATAIIAGIRFAPSRADLPEETLPQKSVALTSQATISDRQIQTAQNLIEKSPSDPKGYNALCAAFIKKARETGDFGFNAKAETALNRSFEAAAAENNYDAIKLKAMLLLVYHRFDEALETAGQAKNERPDDSQNYGAMTDALIELGRYDEAFDAARAMMNLRPGTNSYTRAAYLRELQGDVKGAIEAMRAAAEAAPDPETVAWCRVHLGDLLLNAGNLTAAEHEFDIALYHFPDYHLALAGKARARLAFGDLPAAIEFYKQAQARVPLPETAIALGDLYTKLGQPDEAKKQYDLLEFIERTNQPVGGTYSRLLALFYADHDIKLDEALAIAERERAARSDIYTCDALAWCLYKKGDFADAKKAIDEALRLGTRDARISYHAGMIAQSLGNRADAVKRLRFALKINPAFDILQADVAKQKLSELNT
ncbi:MAG: tetratricopeptide repeat protein [Acidobacteriota bacterium]|nr:tetratricopeptide repeat protein [Acidobacteriota bacterium]